MSATLSYAALACISLSVCSVISPVCIASLSAFSMNESAESVSLAILAAVSRFSCMPSRSLPCAFNLYPQLMLSNASSSIVVAFLPHHLFIIKSTIAPDSSILKISSTLNGLHILHCKALSTNGLTI